MKKILIILICGFAFTQSIQTKQVEVTITDWSLLGNGQEVNGEMYKELDLSNYLNLDGNYIVRIDDWEILDESFNSFNELKISRCNNNDGMGTEFIYYNGGILSFSDMSGGSIRMRSDCHKLNINIAEEVSSNITFWVTGMFEDEGVGLQGDMNDDEVINVTDIIALVNIIIGD